jgi:hypothetical protein
MEGTDVAKREAWRTWVHTQIQERVESGTDKNAPDLSRSVRDDMPWQFIGACAYVAVHKEVVQYLKDRYDALRATRDGKMVYQTHDQLELAGIVEWVKGQMGRRDALLSSINANVARWKKAHPECGLSLNEILQLAEQ